MTGWTASWPVSRAAAEAAMAIDLDPVNGSDAAPVLAAREVDEAVDKWQVDAYFDQRPTAAMLAALAALIPGVRAHDAVLARLPDDDWVTRSQQELAPTRAGRFYVHTPDNAGDPPPGAHAFCIAASQAFGTGGHATTSGCLVLLDRLARRGARFGAIADIGTGTGLLAFAARALWPGARVTASDIDPVSINVTADNAAVNLVPLGAARGRVLLRVAAGTHDRRVLRRAPYDLLIANILAGPLIALAPDFAAASAPGSHVVLAGLIAGQRRRVLAAYRAQGFALVAETRTGDWPCLLLVRRAEHGRRRKRRARHRVHSADASFGSW